MEREYFKNLEHLTSETPLELSAVVDRLAFNEQGLIPIITQDATTREVLMFAWMNKEALYETLSKNYMTYWSRSRKKLWVKGETSGHFQALVSMSFDCDGDVVLCLVNQRGAACHTGRPNCFYLPVNTENHQVTVQSTTV
ncbi:MAG: phosphoribosyl-AMP cyclohydrolase [Gammaproteobacteria bacterium]|nr:phosphoribosyl-AMP cyclohydrolase [Gammaproteobacteria bacterium]